VYARRLPVASAVGDLHDALVVVLGEFRQGIGYVLYGPRWIEQFGRHPDDLLLGSRGEVPSVLTAAHFGAEAVMVGNAQVGGRIPVLRRGDPAEHGVYRVLRLRLADPVGQVAHDHLADGHLVLAFEERQALAVMVFQFPVQRSPTEGHRHVGWPCQV
jgi:hypothetical protein